MMADQYVRGAARRRADVSPPLLASGWGWYFYGTSARDEAARARFAGGPGLDDGEPVRLLPLGDLAAVVSAVPLAELGAEAIRARVRDAGWLEAMVRGHGRVVEAVFGECAVLPARFGCVYPTDAELAAALERSHDALVAHLRRLRGCEEWGVRLYADPEALARRVAAEDPAVGRHRLELAAAPPGRAYFLRRRIADGVAAATEQALGGLAQEWDDHLGRFAIARRASPGRRTPRAADREAEVLRAAYLVQRPRADAFVAELHRLAASQEWLRCEYSGPWPPYSFAEPDEDVPG